MIIEKAYAKVNLFLNITGKRDDGYHSIETVMSSIDLYDTLVFRKSSKIKITSNVQITENPKDNLVYKIAAYLQKEFEIFKGVHINIDKNIPMGAGLAGGSADAAATLRGLNKFWDIGLDLDELSEIGAMFGSDIPFCVYNKTALAEGRGEILTFLDSKMKSKIIVVNPSIHMSTKRVFDEVSKFGFKDVSPKPMIDALKSGKATEVQKNLFNSFEETVFYLEPAILKIKEVLLEMGIKGVIMSGSGSTVYGIIDDEIILDEIIKKFDKQHYVKLTSMR